MQSKTFSVCGTLLVLFLFMILPQNSKVSAGTKHVHVVQVYYSPYHRASRTFINGEVSPLAHSESGSKYKWKVYPATDHCYIMKGRLSCSTDEEEKLFRQLICVSEMLNTADHCDDGKKYGNCVRYVIEYIMCIVKNQTLTTDERIEHCWNILQRDNEIIDKCVATDNKTVISAVEEFEKTNPGTLPYAIMSKKVVEPRDFCVTFATKDLRDMCNGLRGIRSDSSANILRPRLLIVLLLCHLSMLIYELSW